MLRKSFLFLLLTLGLQAQAQSLSPAVFSTAPLHRHPDTDPLATPQDKAWALQQALHPRYYNLAVLTPPQFQVLSSRTSPEIQQWIDHALTRIFQTPMGKNICEITTNGLANKLIEIYGLSAQAAENLQTRCTPSVAKSLPFRPQELREYIFVYTREHRAVVEGWTNNRNVTYIFLSDSDFTENFLFRILIHELAVQLDTKEQWGAFGGLDTLKKTVIPVVYQGERSCEVHRSIRNPLIKYSLSALRAQTIEDQVLRELGLLETQKTSAASCIQEVTTLIPSILRIGPLIMTEQAFLPFQTGHCSADNKVDVFSALQTLANEKVTDLESNSEMSLCEYLRTPRLGTWSFSPIMGGPRPRIGPWSGKDRQDLLDKTGTQRSEFNKQALEILTDHQNSGNHSLRDEKINGLMNFISVPKTNSKSGDVNGSEKN